jgi:hypothetical protein
VAPDGAAAGDSCRRRYSQSPYYAGTRRRFKPGTRLGHLHAPSRPIPPSGKHTSALHTGTAPHRVPPRTEGFSTLPRRHSCRRLSDIVSSYARPAWCARSNSGPGALPKGVETSLDAADTSVRATSFAQHCQLLTEQAEPPAPPFTAETPPAPVHDASCAPGGSRP